MDFNYMADLFFAKFYNQHDPAYGHWITPEIWGELNPYGHVRGQGYFHPSSGLTWDDAGCTRAVQLDLLCADRSPSSIDARLGRVLDNGTDRHVGLHVLFLGMAHYKWMGVESYKYERRVAHEFYPIEGNLDGDITIQGVQLVMDYKTMAPKSWEALRSPKPDHAAQVCTYETLANIEHGLVLYENKGNQLWAGPVQSFHVQARPDLRGLIEEYVVEVLDMLKGYQLQAYEEKRCIANLKFCGYREVCFRLRDLEDPEEAVAAEDKRPEATKRKHLRVVNTEKRPCL